MIEMKSFLYILLSSFLFVPTDDKIIKANVYVFVMFFLGLSVEFDVFYTGC
jgi:hypothetical protein